MADNTYKVSTSNQDVEALGIVELADDAGTLILSIIRMNSAYLESGQQAEQLGQPGRLRPFSQHEELLSLPDDMI